MQPNRADEWNNFLERVNCLSEEELRGSDELEEQLRLWASYRGQTLTRTGMTKRTLGNLVYSSLLFLFIHLSILSSFLGIE